MTARIVSINVSQGGIPKLPVSSIQVMLSGLKGDGHNHEKHCTPLQAISIQDIEKLNELNQQGYSLVSGSTGENLTVEGLNVNSLPIGTMIKVQSGVILELTKIRKPCYVLDVINPRLKEDILGRCGVYARVICAGNITLGDKLLVEIA